MNPRVKKVKALDDFLLYLEFQNGEQKLFDMKPYIDVGVFKELQNKVYFKMVKAENGTICWPHEQDLCPDTLYLDSVPSIQELVLE